MSSLSLYAVQAVLVLDSQGQRVYAKYYHDQQAQAHADANNNNNSTSSTSRDLTAGPAQLKSQQLFERQLAKKTRQQEAQIMVLDNRLVLYKQYVDVTLYLVGPMDENELVLQQAFDTLKNSLELVLDGGIDRKNVQEHYDMVLLTVDEVVDGGIILETDPQTVAARVSAPPSADSQLPLDLDRGLLGAWGFAKSKLQERLQQGL